MIVGFAVFSQRRLTRYERLTTAPAVSDYGRRFSHSELALALRDITDRLALQPPGVRHTLQSLRHTFAVNRPPSGTKSTLKCGPASRTLPTRMPGAAPAGTAHLPLAGGPCRVHVNSRLRNGRELPVHLFLFRKTLLQYSGRAVETELFSIRSHAAVYCDLIVFDSLRG
jgi:hypothetical protein